MITDILILKIFPETIENFTKAKLSGINLYFIRKGDDVSTEEVTSFTKPTKCSASSARFEAVQGPALR